MGFPIRFQAHHNYIFRDMGSDRIICRCSGSVGWHSIYQACV